MTPARNTITTVKTVAALRARVQNWRAAGETVALVPTMGALHEGHLSLIRRAKELAGRVVVSVFVNPTQFGPDEDLDAYPRDQEGDRAKIASAGGDAVYMPDVAEMYPEGFQTVIDVPEVAKGLCGDARPGHFRGVATVVTKLLMQAQPDVAVFGEKDYQQLMVIKRLVRDLDIPVQIVGAPVVREPDGLAMSSRNAYLSADERGRATQIYRSLSAAAREIAAGTPARGLCARVRDELSDVGFGRIDYLEVRDAETLERIDGQVTRPARIFAAAFLGKTRLIDNVPIDPA